MTKFFTKFFNRFTLILSGVLGLGYFYLATGLTENQVLRVFLALPFVLIWILPTFYWSLDRNTDTVFDRIFQWCTFFSMGLLSFLFVFKAIRDVLFALSGPLGFSGRFLPLNHQSNEFVLAFSLVTLAFGVTKALTGPRTRTVSVPLENLPDNLDGLKIAQISDLHVGQTIGIKYVQRVVDQINSLQPDFVTLTGDLVDGTPSELKEKISPLRELTKKYPCFYVTGNHEYYWGAEAWIQEFREMGMKVLENSSSCLDHRGETILIGGIVDFAAQQYGEPKLIPDVMAAIQTKLNVKLKILLAHQPKIAPLAAEAGFDLQLSGHTHAGQFFPWTLLVKAFHSFYLGLDQCKKMWIYVSPGTGFWGPPVRMGSTSEVTLLILKKKLL